MNEIKSIIKQTTEYYEVLSLIPSEVVTYSNEIGLNYRKIKNTFEEKIENLKSTNEEINIKNTTLKNDEVAQIENQVYLQIKDINKQTETELDKINKINSEYEEKKDLIICETEVVIKKCISRNYAKLILFILLFLPYPVLCYLFINYASRDYNIIFLSYSIPLILLGINLSYYQEDSPFLKKPKIIKYITNEFFVYFVGIFIFIIPFVAICIGVTEIDLIIIFAIFTFSFINGLFVYKIFNIAWIINHFQRNNLSDILEKDTYWSGSKNNFLNLSRNKLFKHEKKKISETITQLIPINKKIKEASIIKRCSSQIWSVNNSRKKQIEQIEKLEEDNKKLIKEFQELQKKQIKQIELKYSGIVKEETTKYNKRVSDVQNDYSNNIFVIKEETSNFFNNIKKVIYNIIEFSNLNVETFYDTSKSWDKLSNEKKMPLPYLHIGKSKINLPIIGENIIENDFKEIHLPLWIPFFNNSNILFECDNNTMNEVVDILHGILARSLMALPTGKVKLTIIDPVGLGTNVSPFLSLSEDLFDSKVWVEPNHIEEQLFKLSHHMENVIQKYLQDKYHDMASYNIDAEDVEEAYRILIVINFPDSFNDTSAKKLKSIMKSGAKTGVHTILITDKNKPMPYGFDIKDLENLATTIKYDQNGINVLTTYLKDLNSFSFTSGKKLPIDSIVKNINIGIKDFRTVKVPFKKYLLDKSKWWSKKSGKSFEVAIGRAGAKDKQLFIFDNKNVPHGLLVGMSGSGKSNLLHILILNAIVSYSPDQLELYMIDFKGGVEFVPYADKKIPHARTIAIESEREFGLSVLEGLENELQVRETTFRDQKVSSLNEYHNKFSNEFMPRILLIIDEFQELFTEDDSISDRSAIILDRIVRKGRGFGINILLTTQTLAGISTFRNIKDQIALRIALMCSDSDSRDILAEDNPEARLLNRPGEGIYNSSNGLVEGNNRFQTFFIEKEELSSIVDDVILFEHKSNWNRNKKQIIFRGDAQSYLEANENLFDVNTADFPKKMQLWIGEPVTISNEDVFAVFRKQNGSNLLIVGANEEIAISNLISSLLSISVCHNSKNAAFYVLNFLNIDSELYDKPNMYFQNMPFDVSYGKNKDVNKFLSKIKKEIEGRIISERTVRKNIFFTLISTQRGRKFRKNDYTLSEESEMLSYIISEGSDVGVFTILYIDSKNSFERCFDNDVLNYFSQRIILQMNADDSLTFVNSNIASKLGNNRAVYYDDTEGILRKFRPYNLPVISWVENKIINKIIKGGD